MSNRNAAFVSFCRIVAGLNDQIRVTYNGATSTVTLDPGVRWFGLNPSFSPSDATVYPTSTSLLAHIVAKIGAVPIVQTKVAPVITQASTGHVSWVFPQSGDGFHWGHAATTIDPAWFGVTKSGGTYPDKLVSSTGAEDLSDVSSSLVYIVKTPNSTDVVHDERMSERRRVRSSQVDRGKVFRVNYGSDLGARRFSLLVGGVERERDNAYNSARRWRGELLDSGLSFLYFPDLAQLAAGIKAWDPNESSEVYRYGYQRLSLSADGPSDWSPPTEYGDLHSVWRVELDATPYVNG